MDFIEKIIKFFSGKDRTLSWQEFANEKRGELASTSGDLFVTYQFLDFKFRIGEFTHYVTSGTHTYENKYMIGIVIFTNPSNFELALTPDDLFAKIGKIFKNSDIKIEQKSFDNKFYIKSNNEFKAKTILKDKALLEKITLANPNLLEITNGKGLFDEIAPSGKYMLYYAKQEKFKDVNQLNFIHLLLANLIEKLREHCSIQ